MGRKVRFSGFEVSGRGLERGKLWLTLRVGESQQMRQRHCERKRQIQRDQGRKEEEGD